jgi:hypothetical protein
MILKQRLWNHANQILASKPFITSRSLAYDLSWRKTLPAFHVAPNRQCKAVTVKELQPLKETRKRLSFFIANCPPFSAKPEIAVARQIAP